MLKLRRGTVISEDPLEVEVEGERRTAWADVALVGETKLGDEVIVNVEALDLGLGSGGYDVVHVNLSRGLEGAGVPAEHVMKLNYTSLQHPVSPIELMSGAAAPVGKTSGERRERDRAEDGPGAKALAPVLVVPLHGHLAPVAWAAKQVEPGLRLGFVQTIGGALPGPLSRDIRLLSERGLIDGWITAGAAYGGEHESISLAGALDAAVQTLEWDGAIVGPGPGIIGSESRYGHGGMAALESAHTALALGHPTLLAPRLSSGDPRSRHRGLSHHTATVLELLLMAVSVPIPDPAIGTGNPVYAETSAEAVQEIESLCGQQHKVLIEPADISGYSSSGLPASSMGRDLDEDPLFFAAALAAGRALGGAAALA